MSLGPRTVIRSKTPKDDDDDDDNIYNNKTVDEHRVKEGHVHVDIHVDRV